MLEVLLASVIIGTASYRIWRLIGADTISEPFREQLGPRTLELVSCPWCLGTWIAFLLTFIIDAGHGLPYPVLVGLAAAVVTGKLGE